MNIKGKNKKDGFLNKKINHFVCVKRFGIIPMGIFLIFLCIGKENIGFSKSITFIEPIPKNYSRISEVGLYLDSRGTNVYDSINMRLINPTSSTIKFKGYSESSPWYKIQRWIDGKWQDHQVGWFCGTGLRQCVIPSGQSSVIPVYIEDKFFPLRVGVDYWIGDDFQKIQTVWSSRIEK